MVAADRNVAARDVGNEDSGGRNGRQKERDVCARDVTGLPFNIAYPSELMASQAFANFYGMPLTKPLRRDTRWIQSRVLPSCFAYTRCHVFNIDN